MIGEVTLLPNPAAGRGRAARLLDGVVDHLRAGGMTVRVVCGSDAEHSLALARDAVTAGTGALVVLGGDGMCHLALQAVAGTGTPLGVIPAGTGNDLAAALGVPADPGQATAALLTAAREDTVRTVDVATADTAAGEPAGGTWWGGVLCAGFDSAVNERANAMRWPSGPRRYDLAVLAELARLRARPFTLTLDDGEPWQVQATLVAVGNGPRYGGGLRICPDARLDDGLLDVTVVGPVSRSELVRVKPRLRTGGHVTHPAVTVRRAHRITLSAPGVTAYADGERLAALPVTATCVPGALRVLAPTPRVFTGKPPL